MIARTTKKRNSVKRKTLTKKRAKPQANQPTLYEVFKPFIGMIKNGPPDLAENHKLYASGAKKWK
jgi:hypothetical protein